MDASPFHDLVGLFAPLHLLCFFVYVNFSCNSHQDAFQEIFSCSSPGHVCNRWVEAWRDHDRVRVGLWLMN